MKWVDPLTTDQLRQKHRKYTERQREEDAAGFEQHQQKMDRILCAVFRDYVDTEDPVY